MSCFFLWRDRQSWNAGAHYETKEVADVLCPRRIELVFKIFFAKRRKEVGASYFHLLDLVIPGEILRVVFCTFLIRIMGSVKGISDLDETFLV